MYELIRYLSIGGYYFAIWEQLGSESSFTLSIDIYNRKRCAPRTYCQTESYGKWIKNGWCAKWLYSRIIRKNLVIEIEVESMIGKLKVSQHRTAHNAMAIAEALRISNPALAELVRID